MADTVGVAEFVVKIKDMVTGPMKSIGGTVTSTLKSIGVVAAGNLLATGVLRAVDAAKGFVAQGLAANAEFDKLNNTFTSMLGSQAKATALMGDLQKLAASTPFEMQGLSQATAALLATRQVGQQQVIPMLTKLGDAAAGSTDGFAAMPRVVRAISQMLSKGKLQAEEMMQLAEAGIPAWGALADKMGLSTAEVQKLAQQGKLGVKEIMLLVDGLGDKYKGLAEKQSKTFAGLQSTIADNLNMALAKITRPIYDSMTKIMARIVQLMDSKAFAGIVDGLTAAVSAAVSAFDALVDAGIKIGTSLQPALQTTWALLKEIGANIADNILPLFSGMGSAVDPLIAGLNSVVAWINQILDLATILTADFGKTWAYIGTVITIPFLQAYDQISYLFGTQIPGLASVVAAGFIAAGTEIVSFWQKIFLSLVDFISGIFSDLFRGLTEQFTHIAEAIAAAKRGDSFGLAAALGQAGASGGRTAENIGNRAGKFATDIAGAGGGLAGAGDRIAAAVRGAMEAIPAFKPGGATTFMENQAKALWSQMVQSRNNKRFDRFVDGLGLKEMPGLLGKGIADAIFGAGDLLGDGLGGLMEMFHKDPEAKKEKKNLVSEFVGYADMNKRIQGMIGKEDKDKKAALKAAQAAAAAGQKNVEQGGKLVELTKGVKDGIAKMFVGFGT